MAFALWLDRDIAWAQGTHEYRPMGVAVIAATDLFSPRDFMPARKPPARRGPAFQGLFASLEEVNRSLARSRSREFQKKFKSNLNRQLAVT